MDQAPLSSSRSSSKSSARQENDKNTNVIIDIPGSVKTNEKPAVSTANVNHDRTVSSLSRPSRPAKGTVSSIVDLFLNIGGGGSGDVADGTGVQEEIPPPMPIRNSLSNTYTAATSPPPLPKSPLHLGAGTSNLIDFSMKPSQSVASLKSVSFNVEVDNNVDRKNTFGVMAKNPHGILQVNISSSPPGRPIPILVPLKEAAAARSSLRTSSSASPSRSVEITENNYHIDSSEHQNSSQDEVDFETHPEDEEEEEEGEKSLFSNQLSPNSAIDFTNIDSFMEIPSSDAQESEKEKYEHQSSLVHLPQKNTTARSSTNRLSYSAAGIGGGGGGGAISSTQRLFEKEADGNREVVVELTNIHKTYLLGIEGVAALRGVSLKIFKGEWVVIYGTSGGGKTSLLNMIGTIDRPTKGELKICGTLIGPNTKDEVFSDLRLRRLGFVFQTFNLIPSMTALENVELPMVLKGIFSPAERKKKALNSLERVGLGHRINQFPSKLSGGEQQRVTIARALANSPELLLLDEPTGDLDTANTNKVIELLHELNQKEDITMVMVTHDVYLKNFCHRVVYMRDGKVARIEKVSQRRRDNALAELERKMVKIRQQQQILSNPLATGRSSNRLNESQAAVKSSAFSLAVGGERLETIEVHAIPTTRLGLCTEIREPGDYETYSENSGVPRKLSNEAFPETYLEQLLKLGL